MTPRGVWISKLLGIGFTVAVMCTVTVNYSLAVGCGDRCYPESDAPTDFPDHLFISSALLKGPTRIIGIIGFSMAAVVGVLAGMGRYLQIESLVAYIEEMPLQQNLHQRNRGSLKYILLFGVNLVLLSIFTPLEGHDVETIIHYTCCLLTFTSFLVFVYLQVCRIERDLISHVPANNIESPRIPFLHPESNEVERCVRSFERKRLWIRVTIGLGLAFFGGMQLWEMVNEGSVAYSICALAAECFEVLSVTSGCLFIGLTDFATVQEQFQN